jgi:putative mycofactocin binding protein MftB
LITQAKTIVPNTSEQRGNSKYRERSFSRQRQGLRMTMEPRYLLGKDTAVREEDFGLLFYTMDGPRLFFLSSGDLLGSEFFRGKHTLCQWIQQEGKKKCVGKEKIASLQKMLDSLRAKGVLIEC